MKMPTVKNMNLMPPQGVYEKMSLKEGATYQPMKKAPDIGIKIKSPWFGMKTKEYP